MAACLTPLRRSTRNGGDALVPQVLDDQRNAAYEAAIRRAVEEKRASGHAIVTAVDVGAGSGLLSMMAARLAGTHNVELAKQLLPGTPHDCVASRIWRRTGCSRVKSCKCLLLM